MKRYNHLSLEEREELYALKKAMFSLGDIAKRLKRNKGTLSRELHRNAKYGNAYSPIRAQKKAERRTYLQRRKAPLKNSIVYLFVREHIRKGWSPELIGGRLPYVHPGESVCPETIYRYVYQKSCYVKREKLWRYLPLARKKRMKKDGRRVRRDGRIPEAISIDLRPPMVATRSTIGHWETDNVIGRQTDDSALSVTVERLTRITMLTLGDRTAKEKLEGLFKRFSKLPESLRQTLTADNGKENTLHKEITRSLGMTVYFCHAYHSWEKGTVENMNGRIRRFLPKGESLDGIGKKTIAQIEWELNNTPRKCLNFKTPLEVLGEILDTTKTSSRCTSD